jgi:hypothetical protein
VQPQAEEAEQTNDEQGQVGDDVQEIGDAEQRAAIGERW